MGDLQRVNSITAEGRLKVCKINDRCILFPFTGGMIMLALYSVPGKNTCRISSISESFKNVRIIVVIGT